MLICFSIHVIFLQLSKLGTIALFFLIARFTSISKGPNHIPCSILLCVFGEFLHMIIVLYAENFELRDSRFSAQHKKKKN